MKHPLHEELNKVILEVFPNTEDFKLVDTYFSNAVKRGECTDNYEALVQIVFLKNNSKLLLEQAKKLEEHYNK